MRGHRDGAFESSKLKPLLETPTATQEKGTTIVIASWNVNSIKARLEHVTNWLMSRKPDVLLLQELKGTQFPSEVFSGLGYESVAVTQKAYNGVAILSRLPIEQVSNALSDDESDTHARYLEVIISGVRIVDIYLRNGNPIGTEKSNTSSPGWNDCW